MKVGDCMIKDPHAVREDASMKEVVMLMRQHHIRHLPVTEGTILVGIVTDRDIRRHHPRFCLAWR